MAFTTRSDRAGLPMAPTSTPVELGPGYYGQQDIFGPKPKAFAPFTSLTDKFVDPGGVARGKDAPPPGTYDVTMPWGAPGPGATGSGLPCKFVPFKASSDRFGAGSVFGGSSGDEKPGPGTYKLKGMSDLPAPQHSKSMGKPDVRPAELRAMSAPSIPVGHQCWGYSEGPRGLIRHSGPRNYAGVKSDSIGPDIYTVSLKSTKHAAAARSFGKSEQRPTIKGSTTPGPGMYKLKPFGGGAPARRSASFMSTSERVKSTKAKEEPGPGAYEPKNRAIKVQSVRADQQFFHSTAERFPSGGRRDEEDSLRPGPGAYVVKRPVQDQVTNLAKGSDRFGGYGDFTEPWRSCCESPGPGTYAMELAIDEEMGAGESVKGSKPIHSFSILAHQGSQAFGSTTKRFTKGKPEEMPGPAAYGEQARGSRSSDDAYGKKVRDSLPDNAFRSKTVKLKVVGMLRDTKPDPGAYDPKFPKGDIPRVRKPTEGFLASASRFKYIEEDPHPGPGQYPGAVQYQSLGDKPTVNRAVGQSLGFAVSEKREDAGIRRLEKEATPGPGTYDVAIDLNSKTHNQLFSPNVTIG